ncbi:acetoacetate decarboxylase family protein [Nocardioides sp. 616]|uniref:acetoacetate decarboxylase family protein n=1 Tax=Nocardioides sp. 616 TaxID=2268090 RepID=UPI000CE4DB84|nr:acetoacetate decarboxylase family protein [Nocardioides sp. 616]
MPFPSPPWQLRGQLWGSLFRAAPPDQPRGLFVVAFVSYEAGSTCEYSELLVARRAEGTSTALTVRDMWVDSEPSREAGRALWALPKELAVFHHDQGTVGPVARHSWRASTAGRTLASAEFVDASALSARVPVRATTRQPVADGGLRVATVTGSTRGLPCLGHWSFAPDGALGWLADRHPVLSFRLRRFSATIL